MSSHRKEKTLNAVTGIIAVTAAILGIIRIREYAVPEPIPGQVAQHVPDWQKLRAVIFMSGIGPHLSPS